MDWGDRIEHGSLFLRLMDARRLSLVPPPVISYGLRQTTIGPRRLQGKSDLLSLLEISRNCSCKDARDKVYAIMGLLQQQAVLPLRADYSPHTTAGWVFLQVAAWHIATTGSLEILAQVDGTSAMNMPSWVPDWIRKSPTSLPVQLEVIEGVESPRLLSADGALLFPTAILNYPLSCVLEVTGRRCGTVWTDTRIFGKALTLTSSIEGVNVDRVGNFVAPISHPRTNGCHWLHKPSKNHGTQGCSSRLDFWRCILSAYSKAKCSSDYTASYADLQADIPPSFGGFCWNCFERDKIYGEMTRMAPRSEVHSWQ
ncbi:hypothetical protein B0J13DRAFT_642456 [Dactylonectria estremocensis]|uniref:Uncharacterized protein n=1 Tax=Dactylonectria estremocensis TaxID=1079267 RepID=A0A9P9E3E9_9HYPO|nr:hypothetical protein B0J13DRAFT_642456 [Dactylonectria estremocensis]